ncbi:PREDICTED: PHD finger protein 10 isoform X3 [Rhinopithecus bieti]|uniref:PHD finger protein 10 isoform X3 n=1 Tax=Rhinopithecus bieti TaxID=61621 RepID=UPI00083C6523|nr:PREDICTED: PHD finger protein 10 isoform X3 [Rhinopithecus bieti]
MHLKHTGSRVLAGVPARPASRLLPGSRPTAFSAEASTTREHKAERAKSQRLLPAVPPARSCAGVDSPRRQLWMLGEARPWQDDNEDNSNDGTQPSKRRRMGSGDSSRSCETSSQDLGFSYYPAENLIEYKWPPDETGEYYMLQEQVSEYLGVTSFKRKYPERRDLSHKEKLYLRELNVITETQCTLGLTALRSDEVIDLMIKEYPAKHAEYSVILQEKERQRITDHYKEYSQMQQQNTQKVEASKVPEYIKKAAKKAAEFNSNLNRERMEERRAYFDLQTHVIQVPQGKYKVLPTERTKVSSYPVALIPGQFQEYYKRYSPDELRYLPLNTALYEPPLDPELPALDSDGDSDDGEDGRGDEKRKNKGTSDSSSGNVSEGESPPDSQEDSFQGRQKSKDKAATPRKDGPKRSVLSKSVPGYKPKVIPNAICGICLKGKESNKKGKAESLIHCSQCENSGHPSCLDMTVELVSMIKTYPWQCMECKTCIICGQPHHEEEMMFCDVCDRGYHTFCVGLGAIPSGRWICDCCQRAPPTPRKVGRRGKQQRGIK